MSISDIIEQFILDSIGNDDFISISRNQLAEHFNCVPSQINYVLSTRFTLDKGFIIESKRGGGGCINIIRMPDDNIMYISTIINDNLTDISFNRVKQILQKLISEGIINDRESEIILTAVSDKALMVPESIKDKVRASILRNILFSILREISKT